MSALPEIDLSHFSPEQKAELGVLVMELAERVRVATLLAPGSSGVDIFMLGRTRFVLRIAVAR